MRLYIRGTHVHVISISRYKYKYSTSKSGCKDRLCVYQNSLLLGNVGT